MLKRIELISENNKVSEQMRKMFGEWLNDNYPDEDALDNRIKELETELNKINEFKNNINFIGIKEQDDLKTITQFRDEMIDSVMNMLSIQFIHNSSDNEYHKKWMKTLKFNSINELLKYLAEKWNEYGGTNGVLKHLHQSKFIKSRTEGLELQARLEQLKFEDFLLKHNIDLNKEYAAGNLKGSSKDFNDFKSRILNR